MATHSSILAWRIPSAKEPGRATVHVVAKSSTQLRSKTAAAADLLLFQIKCTLFFTILFL